MAVQEDTPRPVLDDVQRAARRRARRRTARVRQLVALGVGLTVLAVAANAVARHGAVAPGVTVMGADLGGLSRADAEQRLKDVARTRLRAPISARVEGEAVDVVPWRAGLRLDVQRTLDRVMGADRVRASLFPFGGGSSIEPVLLLPPEPSLPKSLAGLERDPVDAKPVVTDDGKVRVEESRTGLAIPVEPALAALGRASLAGAATVELKGDVAQPAIPTAAADAVADDARELLSAPIVLTRKGKRIGSLTPAELAPALDVEKNGDQFRVRVAPARVREAIAADVAPYLKEPVDATWTTDGRRATVVPARDGLDLLAVPTARRVRFGGTGDGPRKAEVVLGPREADLTTAEAKSWGIRRLVSSVTTDLGDSSENRIHNVALMAEILDGHVIPPGGSFSFNEVVGPRTEERGFLEGQAIVNGLLVPSIGGGVCQVATTVFGAAFYAGLPITERTNHSFYISHYDLGMDSTVAWGGLDLKFENDTTHGILIRTAADASTMTVNLYSTPTGVEVEKSTSERTFPTEPKDRYILDPTLPPKAIVQTSSGVGGFTVTVSRTVRRDGQVVREDEFTSNYVPEDVIYRVGEGAEVPDGAEVEPPPPERI